MSECLPYSPFFTFEKLKRIYVCYYLLLPVVMEILVIPISFTLCSNFPLGRGLVKESAIIRSVGVYSRLIVSFSMHSRMKWCCVSICFVLPWCIGFLASAMVD